MPSDLKQPTKNAPDRDASKKKSPAQESSHSKSGKANPKGK